MEAYAKREGINEDFPKYKAFKKHLEAFTDEAIEQELKVLLNL